ncbi:MAG: hypothetical protein H7177_07010 [Rhizobacter sp.]|nr:hypothetical protein [Bacteriovorax sp.]
MKYSLLIFIVSFNAWSMDCDGIPEGTVIRLDKDGKSLEKAAVQDQDGIGSCYANQAALLLQSAVPGNPNLSYLNLGLYYTNDKSLKEKRSKGDKLFTRDGKKLDGTVAPENNSEVNGGYSCDAINLALDRQKKSGKGSICKAEDVNLEHSYFDAKTGNNLDLTFEQEKTLASASRYMNTYQKRFGYSFDKDSAKAEVLRRQREDADTFSVALTNFVKNNSDEFLVKQCTKLDPEKAAKILNNTITRALLANTKCYNDKFRMQTNTPDCKSYDMLGSVYTIQKGDNTRTLEFQLLPGVKADLIKALPELYKPDGNVDGLMSGMNSILAKNDRSKPAPAQREKFYKNLLSMMSPEDKKTLSDDYDRVALQKVDDCKKENVLNYFKDKENFLTRAKEDSVLCKYGDLLERVNDMAGILPAKTFNNMSGFVDFLTKKAGLNYDEALMGLIASDCTPEKRIQIPENLKCEKNYMSFTPEDFPANASGLSAKAETVIKENRTKMMRSLGANHGVGLDICTKFWSDTSYDWNKEAVATKNDTCQSTGMHGFHAVTMIGYRCKDNRIQYLAQNSWGPNWKIKDDPFEIENGKIWMDEDKLFKNLQNINYLSP